MRKSAIFKFSSEANTATNHSVKERLIVSTVKELPKLYFWYTILIGRARLAGEIPLCPYVTPPSYGRLGHGVYWELRQRGKERTKFNRGTLCLFIRIPIQTWRYLFSYYAIDSWFAGGLGSVLINALTLRVLLYEMKSFLTFRLKDSLWTPSRYSPARETWHPLEVDWRTWDCRF